MLILSSLLLWSTLAIFSGFSCLPRAYAFPTFKITSGSATASSIIISRSSSRRNRSGSNTTSQRHQSSGYKERKSPRQQTQQQTKHKSNEKVKNVQRKQSPKVSYSSSSTSSSSKLRYTVDDLSQMSVAQAIQESTTSQQLLHTAQRLWLPTDPDLPVHFKTQKIHHDRRIKAASMLLFKLGDCIGYEVGVGLNYDDWWGKDGQGLLLKRAILASSMEFHDNDEIYLNKQSSDMDARFSTTSNHVAVCMALMGIFSIVGYTLPIPNVNDHDDLDQDILVAIQKLIKRVESVAWEIPMHQAVEVRWAIRGILARVGNAFYEQLLLHHDSDQGGDMREILKNYKTTASRGEKLNILQSLVIPNLQHRTEKLPFDILPLCLDWNSFHVLSMEKVHDIVKTLLNEIPFQFDTITTKSGSKVEERRGTAWLAEKGIGSLAYSGKLMTPRPIPEIVKRVMRQVEEGILDHRVHEKLHLCRETLGMYFDCALCNHYPNEESKCKFHTDPEHGTYWERLTCVVSAGNQDVRKFAFRPIPNENDWDAYEVKEAINKKGITSRIEDGIVPAVVPLFPGDVVVMDNECNDLFHHAVYGKQDIGDNPDMNGYGRVSLVLKRAMDQGNGRKGHGKAGEGRRSKRM